MEVRVGGCRVVADVVEYGRDMLAWVVLSEGGGRECGLGFFFFSGFGVGFRFGFETRGRQTRTHARTHRLLPMGPFHEPCLAIAILSSMAFGPSWGYTTCSFVYLCSSRQSSLRYPSCNGNGLLLVLDAITLRVTSSEKARGNCV